MSQPLDFEKLRLLGYKLRCSGHFLESQDPNHVFPSDFDKVQYGFSMLINEIVAEMLEITERAEKKQS